MNSLHIKKTKYKSKYKTKKIQNVLDIKSNNSQRKAYLFVVTSRTLPEVCKYKIFGLPENKNEEMIKFINPYNFKDKTPLYLLNKTDNWLSGPYYAYKRVEKEPIIKDIWNNKFPSHVQIYLQKKTVPRILFKDKIKIKEGLILEELINKIMSNGKKIEPISELMEDTSKIKNIKKSIVKIRGYKDKDHFIKEIEKDKIYIEPCKDSYTFKPVKEEKIITCFDYGLDISEDVYKKDDFLENRENDEIIYFDISKFNNSPISSPKNKSISP